MTIESRTKKFIIVSLNEEGQRIDNFLRVKFKHVPKSMIYRIIRKGNVRINKKLVKPEYKLILGDEICIPPIYDVKHQIEIISPHLQKIAILNDMILYEDDSILVINKPSGIAVHGGSGLSFGVIEGLRAIRQNARFLQLVHRLDRETSGALLVAKKRSVLRLLHEQLRFKTIKKEYLALVHGHWKSHVKIVQAPLLKKISKNRIRVVQINKEGKSAKTIFKIEERYKFSTLIRCNPITGRHHQIRVHAKYVGHPIVCDNKYGDAKFDKQLTHTGLTRLFLHATTLTFIHPDTGISVSIQAPLDDQLNHCLKILRAN